ncbi:MAG: BatA domain-containing protein, partial [Rhizobiales bacterium]|nr:BatA domain-containing protein [Hyphomicrobiales bacterium]
MMGLPLGFATPLILTAFLALPLLWFLLRVVPPKPREVVFPPTGLLLDIPPKEESAARTPWWLTVLRLLLAALVIFAAAGPIWNPPAATPGPSGPLVLLIDQGWAAASTWEARMETATGLVVEAEGAGRGVALIPTGDVPKEVSLLLPAQARDRLRSLKPVPYVPDRKEALDLAARHLAAEPQAGLVFLSDGTDLKDAPALADALAALKPAAPPVVLSGGLATPLALAAPDNAADALTVKVLRPDTGAARAGHVDARDLKGLPLGTAAFAFAPGATEADARFDIPVELRNEIARLEISGEASAGAVQLLDKRWRRRAVGLVSGASTDTGQPLLAPTYYLSRALAPFADVRLGEGGAPSEAINRFIDQRVPVIVLTDVGTIPAATRQRLQKYVEDGGVLVRFAGPRLANAQDDLLPVRLRRGGRVLGGSLSWETPQALGSLTADGPFYDVPLPNDVTVTRQVLAEPDGALGERTWGALADGTPLVTGTRRGRGSLVLFHVTADTSWSNLPLSGTFVEMLRRVIALADTAALAQEAPAAGSPSPATQASLPPNRLLNGFGAFEPAGPFARPLPSGYGGRAGAEHPPGFYGPPDGMVALNALLPSDRLVPLDLSALGGRVEPLRAGEPRDLRGPILMAAMLLLLLDALAVLFLAGGLARLGRRRAASAALLAAVALGAGLFAAGLPAPALAQ